MPRELNRGDPPIGLGLGRDLLVAEDASANSVVLLQWEDGRIKHIQDVLWDLILEGIHILQRPIDQSLHRQAIESRHFNNKANAR